MGLLQAAIERVGNPAHPADVTQAFEQGVCRAAHMQDHRQLVALRQLELCAVKLLLGVPSCRGVEGGYPAIQANFTHCHQARVVALRQQGLVELIEVCRSGLRCEQGVNAQGIGVLVGMGQRTHGVEIGGFDRRDDATAHPLRSGVCANLGAICLKFGSVKVAVGVNPEHGARIIKRRP